MEEKAISAKEGLDLITEMIGKAKSTFNENGSSAILWGVTVALCGFVTFAEVQWSFSIGFSIWWLILVAAFIQTGFIIQESKREIVKTHQQAACDVIWLVYGISIACIMAYSAIVPGVAKEAFANADMQLLSKNLKSGVVKEFEVMLPSLSSVYLIIYAFPTIATGLICKFRPMIYGAILCYIFFIISLWVPFKYDMLLIALAGVGNWLIPGLILQTKYKKLRSRNV